MIVLVLILIGLCFGSFVNAFVWRLHEGRNWVNERSECTHCHHSLAPKDLVPVISWLLLRGKCRYCKKKIDDTPLSELLVPTLFVVSYIWWPLTLQGNGLFVFVCWLIFVIGFVALTLFDLRWFLLPDAVVFPLMGLAAVQVLGSWLLFGGSWHAAVGSVIGAIAISGTFWLLYYMSQGKWIGFGDVKLGVVLGLLAGGLLQACLVLFIASFIGMLVALPLLVMGKASRKSHLPFGPLLLAGMVVVQLFGASILNGYTRLLTP